MTKPLRHFEETHTLISWKRASVSGPFNSLMISSSHSSNISCTRHSSQAKTNHKSQNFYRHLTCLSSLCVISSRKLLCYFMTTRGEKVYKTFFAWSNCWLPNIYAEFETHFHGTFCTLAHKRYLWYCAVQTTFTFALRYRKVSSGMLNLIQPSCTTCCLVVQQGWE